MHLGARLGEGVGFAQKGWILINEMNVGIVDVELTFPADSPQRIG